MRRKPLVILAIALLLVLGTLTLLGSRWAPRALGEFDDLTNPAK
jgi:hypothetical protein